MIKKVPPQWQRLGFASEEDMNKHSSIYKRRKAQITKRMDMYRIANAFEQAAIEGHYEQCRNIVTNFAHVYREEYQAVLSMISVMLMDPAGFTAEEYERIKTAIRKAGNKHD